MIGCLSLYCFMVFGPPGYALDPGTSAVSRAAGTSIQAFGTTNACRNWGDGCTLCNRADEAGPATCSTPGIACTPGPIACAKP